MSKIGKQPIIVPEGVTVTITPDVVTVSGKAGTLTVPRLSSIDVKLDAGKLLCFAMNDDLQTRANWGTMRALLYNAVTGIVASGYKKVLEIEGIGFRATVEGKVLVLNIGFTHQVRFMIPDGITVVVAKGVITISGVDKALVGEVAANIRHLKKPEPYKGTGIRYQGEVIARKEGKKAASAGATAA